jgi:hypothetical protein
MSGPAALSSSRSLLPPSRRAVTVASLIVMICVASAAWWAWRFVSLGLMAVYAEGFRKARMAEE